jgi:S1-C subfamily serine protease
VTRRADPDNRRSQTVTLTDRGAAVVEAARPAYERRAARLVSGLEGGAGGPAAEGLLGWLGFFEPGESTAPRLGVAVASAAVAKRMRAAVGLDELPGALVVRVSPDSPAAAAALGRGDLIRTAAGEPVETLGDLDRAVRAADATLTLGVVRGTTEREVVVTLGG